MNLYRCSMITSGKHAWTENDEALFSDLPEEDQKIARFWVLWNLWPRKTFNRHRTSYGLKHVLERDTSIYLSNNQFKDLMLQCGYRVENPKELNWVFNVTVSRGAKLRANGAYPEYLSNDIYGEYLLP